jgi:hypothetical protein
MNEDSIVCVGAMHAGNFTVVGLPGCAGRLFAAGSALTCGAIRGSFQTEQAEIHFSAR